ncbi:unnamed protein product [Allacma fusca]|uniref:Uncharacterized protein n=1 Tax=Allacma fusca TaxID=39272 RepID=A0A8J2JPE4_9HEXA|nr:unnamed protein product [Allacma fusca]
MKGFIFVASLIIFVTDGASSQQKWNPKEIALSSTNPSQTVTIDSKATEFIFMVAPETRELYGRARYTIDVFIDELNCTTNNQDKEPSYLLFDSESGEVSIPSFTKCAVLKKDELPAFQFNNGSNLGADKIRVKPVGAKWSRENYGIIRAELKITRQIILGDETPQVDIQIDPTIDYEILSAQGSKFCSQRTDFKCSVSMTVFGRFNFQEEGLGGLKYTVTDSEGVKSEVMWSSRKTRTSMESLDSMKFELVGEQKDKLNTSVTVNLQLYSDETHRCPSGYFTCDKTRGKDKNSASCIPYSWRCDGRYNCPSESDESIDECQNYCDYVYTYSGWSLAWAVLTLVLMLSGLILVMHAIRRVCLRRPVPRPRTNANSEAYPTKDVPPTYQQATHNRI